MIEEIIHNLVADLRKHSPGEEPVSSITLDGRAYDLLVGELVHKMRFDHAATMREYGRLVFEGVEILREGADLKKESADE